MLETKLHFTRHIVRYCFLQQTDGLRLWKKESKGINKGNAQESQTPQIEHSRRSQTNMDQEFDKIIEKTDEDSLLPSQNLLAENSLK